MEIDWKTRTGAVVAVVGMLVGLSTLGVSYWNAQRTDQLAQADRPILTIQSVDASEDASGLTFRYVVDDAGKRPADSVSYTFSLMDERLLPPAPAPLAGSRLDSVATDKPLTASVTFGSIPTTPQYFVLGMTYYDPLDGKPYYAARVFGWDPSQPTSIRFATADEVQAVEAFLTSA